MNALLFFMEAEGGGQVEQIARTFGVDWPHLMAQVISFSIVCLLLYLFAYKPILKMLSARRELIAQGLANSEQIKAELAKTETQRQEVLARANIEATQFIEEARAVLRDGCGSRRLRRPSQPPNRSRIRPTLLPLRTIRECWPNLSERWAGWSCKPPPPSPARF